MNYFYKPLVGLTSLWLRASPLSSLTVKTDRNVCFTTHWGLISSVPPYAELENKNVRDKPGRHEVFPSPFRRGSG